MFVYCIVRQEASEQDVQQASGEDGDSSLTVPTQLQVNKAENACCQCPFHVAKLSLSKMFRIFNQGFSQDLETGCPKLANMCGLPVFHGRPESTKNATITMYLLKEIRHNILILCLRNCTEVCVSK